MDPMVRGACVLLLIAAGALAQTPDERTLARHGLEPTREALGEYLRKMFPGNETTARIESLVRDLGSSLAVRRELAMRELLRLRVAPIEALERAADDDDPEVRRRAHILLERARARLRAEVLYCVFRTIRSRQIEGLAAEILQAVPVTLDPYVGREARAALVETARPADLPLLMRAATEGRPEVRMASLAAVGKLRGKAAVKFLRDALESPSLRVRFTAAHELANLGDRSALPVLVDLLEAQDEWVRIRAVSSLRAVAGHSLGYSAAEPEKTRRDAVKLWRAWFAERGATATWETPLRARRVSLGRTLVAVYSKHQVIEFDRAGNVTWTLTGIKTPWAVRGLPNGHRLVALYSDNIVTEYDAAGKRIWSSDTMPGSICSVERLRSGNILVAVGTPHDRIIEIGRDGKQVWSLAIAGQPVCARELPNDHLLITLHEAGRVIEIDRTGRVLWELRGLNRPYSATRLPNRNVLVAAYGGGRLAEFDREGTLVWQKTGLKRVFTAARLEDGSTLYGDSGGVHRINPAGRPTWHHKIPNDQVFIDRY